MSNTKPSKKSGPVCREIRGGCGKRVIVVRQPYDNVMQRQRGWLRSNQTAILIGVHEDEFDENKHTKVKATESQFYKCRLDLEDRCIGRRSG